MGRPTTTTTVRASRLSDRPNVPIKVVVMHRARISLGHALLHAGVIVRKVSTAMAAVVTLALLLTLLATAGGLAGQAQAPLSAGAAAWVSEGDWQRLATLAVGLIGCRVIVAAMIAALGWFVLPTEHRVILADVAERARGLR